MDQRFLGCAKRGTPDRVRLVVGLELAIPSSQQQYRIRTRVAQLQLHDTVHSCLLHLYNYGSGDRESISSSANHHQMFSILRVIIHPNRTGCLTTCTVTLNLNFWVFFLEIRSLDASEQPVQGMRHTSVRATSVRWARAKMGLAKVRDPAGKGLDLNVAMHVLRDSREHGDITGQRVAVNDNKACSLKRWAVVFS